MFTFEDTEQKIKCSNGICTVKTESKTIIISEKSFGIFEEFYVSWNTAALLMEKDQDLGSNLTFKSEFREAIAKCCELMGFDLNVCSLSQLQILLFGKEPSEENEEYLIPVLFSLHNTFPKLHTHR